LTAAAYLSKGGLDVLLLEKNKECGGLLTSFKREGFTFDAGARAIINSGMVRPMLEQLGIELDLLNSPVTVGIGKEMIDIASPDSLNDFKRLLEKLYADSKGDIAGIAAAMKKVTDDTAVLYGIDNPLFRDMKKDKKYIFKVLLPWLPRFYAAMRRINRLQDPIEDFLKKRTSNQALVDIIAQQFFKNTPAFFALGYFYVYLDYLYPRGGTGDLPGAMIKKIAEWKGRIQTGKEIIEIIPAENLVKDRDGQGYPYDRLIWCADSKTFYQAANPVGLDERSAAKFTGMKERVLSSRGGDSVFTLFLGVDQPPDDFRAVSRGHFFYTPSNKGLGETHRSALRALVAQFEETPKDKVLLWLKDFCRYNTYEISIPALRDPSLAPRGKTGLIVSLLFEYDLTKKIREAGWYEEFKMIAENLIIETLSDSIYPGLKDKILFKLSSTPLSIEDKVGSSEGAITGWSFEGIVPAVTNLRKVARAVKTPLPNVLQAGQWVFSPSGVPIAILTGSLAAKQIMRFRPRGQTQ
jgi:phytoene dehydrogenase-like protein